MFHKTEKLLTFWLRKSLKWCDNLWFLLFVFFLIIIIIIKLLLLLLVFIQFSYPTKANLMRKIFVIFGAGSSVFSSINVFYNSFNFYSWVLFFLIVIKPDKKFRGNCDKGQRFCLTEATGFLSVLKMEFFKRQENKKTMFEDRRKQRRIHKNLI